MIDDVGDSLAVFMMDCRAMLDPKCADKLLCHRQRRGLMRAYVNRMALAGLTLDEAFRHLLCCVWLVENE